MTDHTPTPWVAVSRPEFNNGLTYTSVEPVTPDEVTMRPLAMANGAYHVCRMTHTAAPHAINIHRANAAFIVKSCNAHDALVKALNDLHVWCEVEGCGDQAEIIKDAFIAAGITEYRCVNCDGLGEWDEGPLPATSSQQISPDYRHIVCSDCEGKGTIAISPHKLCTPEVKP